MKELEQHDSVVEEGSMQDIIGRIAWKRLKIADIDHLDEEPEDVYARRAIAEALVDAYLHGFCDARNRRTK